MICNDINECTDGIHSCPPRTNCTNTMGSFSCLKNYPGCPPGTYSSTESTCHPCPPDSYNNMENHKATECFPCPESYVTNGTGSTSVSQCKCKFEMSPFFSKFVISFLSMKRRASFVSILVSLDCLPGNSIAETGKCIPCEDGSFQSTASQVKMSVEVNIKNKID